VRTVPQHGQGSGVTAEDLEALRAFTTGGGHLSDGSQVKRFEEEFCAYTGAEHAVAVSSCTMGLELVGRALGLRPGDEVISPSLTFQATVSSFVGTGVRVRFAEVDPATLCLDPASVERLISPRTRAVYTVHYGGHCGDVARLRELTDAHGLRLVEDCAHAIGAFAYGRSAGTWGDAGCWSFHSLKNISTLGQGGMITVRDGELAERLRRLRCMEPDADFLDRHPGAGFGAFPRPSDPRRVTHEKNAWTHNCGGIRAPGLNAQLGDPAAVVGRSQLRRLPDLVARRQRLAAALDEALSQIEGIETVPASPGLSHAAHLYAFRLTDASVNRDELVSLLIDRGIEVVLRYFPLHLLPEWRFGGSRFGDLPVTERVWFEQLMNLPISPQLDAEDTAYMAGAVADAVRELRRAGAPAERSA